ncbi:MAG: alanine racemase [Candidatus Kapabacteria bacterium]|nr:alanine racemase [Candidatus Kapabacteria bacterium]
MRSTIATIDLDALEWNLSVIRRQAPEKAILGMVKANAYGHGMIAIANALQHCGVDVLGTAFVDEALELKKAGISIPIMVLTPIEEHDCTAVVENDLVTVACDMSQVAFLSHAAVTAGKIAEVHLYIDTGMHREGFRPHDAVEAAKVVGAMPGIRLTGVCTHFATSDEPHSSFFREQLSTFNSVLSKCAAAGSTFASIHAANTAAMWQSDLAHFTMVRPGLSLYGYVLPGNEEMTLRPVMSITSRVLSVRRAWPGESVSYGRRYVVPEEQTIVTVPIGYGDGYLRSLTGAAFCLIGGRRYPIVGTICMDELMVNVGDADVKLGDEVVLMGQQTGRDGITSSIDANDIAQWASTIPYDVTTSVSARVPRCFTGRLAALAKNQTQ